MTNVNYTYFKKENCNTKEKLQGRRPKHNWKFEETKLLENFNKKENIKKKILFLKEEIQE